MTMWGKFCASQAVEKQLLSSSSPLFPCVGKGCSQFIELQSISYWTSVRVFAHKGCVCAHVCVHVYARVCTLHSLEIFRTTDLQRCGDHYKLKTALKPPATYNAILNTPGILE